MENCVFCKIAPEAIFLENKLAFCIADKFPKAEGHSLVIVKRHVTSFFDIFDCEMVDVKQLLCERQEQLLAHDASIKGFNVRVNVGIVAGQTVMHCHFHLIPRRDNDGLTALGD